MGSKKRGSNSVEDEVKNQFGIGNDKDVPEHSRKKMKREKKDKKKEIKVEDGSAGPSVAPDYVKPMERKKNRKALDKERHRAESESKPKQFVLVVAEDNDSEVLMASSPSASSCGLPEFHIGVFKELASADVFVREKAAEALVMELVEVQKAYDKLEDKVLVEGGLKLEAEKDDGLNNCAPSVRYAVRRLIRGVSSSREEVRDCLLGRLFAYGALGRSGRLTQDWTSDKNSMYIKEFTSSLISLATRKRYLQEPAVSVILELVDKLPVEALLNQVLEAPGLQEWFEGATEVGNPDALFLALKMREKISVDSRVFGKLLPYPYCSNGLFSADHLSSLANCLKESTFCQPRVHSVWPVLVNTLLPDNVVQDVDKASGLNSIRKHKKNRKYSSSEEDIEKNIRSFCDVIIEGSLLMSSHDRKHLALDAVLLLLPKLPASCVHIILSYKLVQCLMDILSTKDSWLFKVAQFFLKELSDWVKYDDDRRVAVIVALQKHSNGKFDSITRTKTVKSFLEEFKTESGCMLFIQNLMSMFLNEGNASEEPSDQSQTTDDNSEIGSIEDKDSAGTLGTPDFLKSWVVDSLPGVLKHSKLDPEAKFRVQKEILKFLAIQGLFSSSLGTEVTSFELQEKFRWPKVPTSSALCRMCIEQLQLLLANAQKGEAPHAVASGLEANDLGSYFMRFLSTLCNIPSVSLFRALGSDDEKAFQKLLEVETRLSREERNCGLSTDANKLHALRYLLIQLLLQVILRPGEFSEAASELIICCKKAFGASELLDSSGEDEPDGDGTPKLMDVLVDTFLSLLPQSSAPMRSAIEQVFKYFCYDVTDDGLLRMLRVIKKDLKPARKKDTDREDHDDDDDDLVDIEEAEEYQEPPLDIGAPRDIEEAEEYQEPDETETGETGESDEQTDDSEAVVRVQASEDEPPEDSDDSDGGMDDEAMFRMDAFLAQKFKKSNNQAGSGTAHSQLVLFKLRVLSLLEIYLHENPGKPQVLKVFSNLVQAFVNPHTTEGSEQLGQRIWGILQKKIFKAKDYPRGGDVQLSLLESLLEENLKLASKPFKKKKSANNPSKIKQSASWNRHKMITSLAQNSTFWILKIIDARNFPVPELQRVVDIFKGFLTIYFNSKKSQMKPDFLKELFRRRPWIRHHLLGFFLEKCGSAKSEFRQVESLDLVIEILKSLISVKPDGSGQEASKKILKSHIPKLCHLVQQLVTDMPEKQSRRVDVRKFCGKLFQFLTTHNLTTSFLRTLEPEVHASCESQLGELFLTLKKQQQ
ncbi:unnamed protein product [Ilex paraguariensis]|uniref:DNA polymerase V n=1 Tax=Ilex paraguariensis TaxID=185542 RepID=A0ABC8QXI7_9AQUA